MIGRSDLCGWGFAGFRPISACRKFCAISILWFMRTRDHLVSAWQIHLQAHGESCGPIRSLVDDTVAILSVSLDRPVADGARRYLSQLIGDGSVSIIKVPVRELARVLNALDDIEAGLA